jgi:prefoldin subunit 5
MRDVEKLLTEKATELERLRKEIESLRAIIPLLADEKTEPEPERKPVANVQAGGAAGLFSSADKPESKFWSFGRRRRNK